MRKITATARVAMDPPEFAFPVAIRAAGEGWEVYDAKQWTPAKLDGAGRWYFIKMRKDGTSRDLVTFLTDL